MVEMKVYHCTNAEDNPMPVWMQMKPHQQKMPEKNEMDIVEQFKQNPDAFFPDFMKVLYGNLGGSALMTGCMLIYAAAYRM